MWSAETVYSIEILRKLEVKLGSLGDEKQRLLAWEPEIITFFQVTVNI